MTLLEETEAALAQEALAASDVVWVGSGEMWFDWSDFAQLATPIEGQKVPGDLVVVGSDWWLDRRGANKGWSLGVQRRDVPVKPGLHHVPQALSGRDTVLPDDVRQAIAAQAAAKAELEAEQAKVALLLTEKAAIQGLLFTSEAKVADLRGRIANLVEATRRAADLAVLLGEE
jgi:hypothetical protein